MTYLSALLLRLKVMFAKHLAEWHVIGTPPKLKNLCFHRKDHGLLGPQSFIFIRKRKQQSVTKSVDLKLSLCPI